MPVVSKVTLSSLPVEILERVQDHLDMKSLLTFGRTSVDISLLVSATLQRDRDRIVRHYYRPAPAHVFLSRLTRNRAVITGEAALAFIARDLSLLTQEMEVCVPCTFSHDLLQEFEEDSTLEHAWPDSAWPAINYNRTTDFLFGKPGELQVRVRCSPNESPFTPMASYPSSALFNYMDAFSFGCAYPALTMNGRGVVPGMAELGLAGQLRAVRISNRGFDQSQCPAVVAFPPIPFTAFNRLGYLNDPNREELINTTCLRHMYLCPGQTRFFGDRASLIEFFEPDMVDYAVMAHCNFPPYGPTAVWRMQDSYCDYDCASGDYLLGEKLYAVCAVGPHLRFGRFTTRVAGRIEVGESQHRRVWNAGVEEIRLLERGVKWGTPGHPAYLP